MNGLHVCRGRECEDHKPGAMASVRRAAGELAAGWDPRGLLPSRSQRTSGCLNVVAIVRRLSASAYP